MGDGAFVSGIRIWRPFLRSLLSFCGLRVILQVVDLDMWISPIGGDGGVVVIVVLMITTTIYSTC